MDTYNPKFSYGKEGRITNSNEENFNEILSEFLASRKMLQNILKRMRLSRYTYKNLLYNLMGLSGIMEEVIYSEKIPGTQETYDGIVFPFQEVYEVEPCEIIDKLREIYGVYRHSVLSKAEVDAEISNLKKSALIPLETCYEHSTEIKSAVKKCKQYARKIEVENENLARKKRVSPIHPGSFKELNQITRTSDNSKVDDIYRKLYLCKNSLIRVIPQFLGMQNELILLSISELKSAHNNLLSRFNNSSELSIDFFSSQGQNGIHNNSTSLCLKQAAYIDKFRNFTLAITNRIYTHNIPLYPSQAHLQTPRSYTTNSLDKNSSIQGTACIETESTDSSPIDLTNFNNMNLESIDSKSEGKPLCVIAAHNYVGEEGDLSFEKGDVIEVIDYTDNINSWWKGRLNDKVGLFPANYVDML